MTRTIRCEPLTEFAYASYGGIISTDIVNGRTVTVNNGTSRRTPEVVPTQNLYAKAESQIPARAVLNVSLASPREVELWKGGVDRDVSQGDKRVLKVKMLERHRYSTQSFVPMGAEIKYLVVVTEGEDAPDIDRLRGFVASDKQGVCYGPGIWHAPMAVIDRPVSFAIVQHINGVPEEDCQFFTLEEELEIVF